MRSVLLHICCAGCAGVCIERLCQEGFRVWGLFYNPNIHPRKEYIRRGKDLNILSDRFDISFVDCGYDPAEWFNFIKGYEQDKEGGRRCGLCFEMRLKKSFEVMKTRGLDFFTTTLTVSPHKNSKVINHIGVSIGKDKFLVRDFKKQDGFKQSVEISKELRLYRQTYCGCVFSQKHEGVSGGNVL